MPRVLARLPYGEDFKRVTEFNFEEEVDGKEHNNYTWMGAAWAYAARITDAFAQWGWMARTRGVEGGGKVEGLPVHTFPTDDGDVAMKCPTEIAISDRREFELSNLGFLPLLHSKGSDFAVFMGAQSCQKPKTYFDPAANANAELSAKFNLLLCTSRFAHYLKVMARDKIGSFMEAGECGVWLNNWISNYVVPNPENVGDATKAKQPLAGRARRSPRGQGQARLLRGRRLSPAALPARGPLGLDATGRRGPQARGEAKLSSGSPYTLRWGGPTAVSYRRSRPRSVRGRGESATFRSTSISGGVRDGF